MSSPIQRLSFGNFWHLMAVGFGSGLSPWMPGTVGTLAAIPLYLLLAKLPMFLYVFAVLLAFLIGIKACQVTTDAMQVHDHGTIVWDEFVGFWITMLIVPVASIEVLEWHWLLTGFVLFRFFDIVKPWPIRWLDRQVKGGLGIMLDDVVAGLMAAISLVLVGYWAHWAPF